MFSGMNALGDQQVEVPEWYGMDEPAGSDVDFISANFYSPDAGYPPARIENYDEELVQPVTLNGMGVAPYRGSARQMRTPHFKVMSSSRPATRSRATGPAQRTSQYGQPTNNPYGSVRSQ